MAESDLKALDKEKINEFKTSIYCTDPAKDKALVMFLGDKESMDFIPVVKAVDVFSLIPTRHSIPV